MGYSDGPRTLFVKTEAKTRFSKEGMHMSKALLQRFLAYIVALVVTLLLVVGVGMSAWGYPVVALITGVILYGFVGNRNLLSHFGYVALAGASVLAQPGFPAAGHLVADHSAAGGVGGRLALPLARSSARYVALLELAKELSSPLPTLFLLSSCL